SRVASAVQGLLELSHRLYRTLLTAVLKARLLVLAVFVALIAAAVWLAGQLAGESAPQEARGSYIILVSGPEGATFHYFLVDSDEIEARLTPMLDSGELERVVIRAPRGFGNIENFNNGFAIISMTDWGQRRDAWTIMDEVREQLDSLPGVLAFPVMRQGFGQRISKPVEFVLGGGTYEELAEWRDLLLQHVRADNPRLLDLDSN